MVPMQYVTLEFLRNNNIILARYKADVFITDSSKRTLMVHAILYLAISLGSDRLYSWISS